LGCPAAKATGVKARPDGGGPRSDLIARMRFPKARPRGRESVRVSARKLRKWLRADALSYVFSVFAANMHT